MGTEVGYEKELQNYLDHERAAVQLSRYLKHHF